MGSCAARSKSVEEAVDNGRLYFWANVLETGGVHKKHTHQDSLVSGVLYLEIEEGNAPIRFTDVRSYANEFQTLVKDKPAFAHTTHELTPRPGELVLFPSWRVHEVPQNTGPR